MSSNNSNDLLISNNWLIENNKDIRDSITFSKNFNLDDNGLDEITVDTCLHFLFQENDNSSNLILELKSRRYLIIGITVVSDARIIEFYGRNGEYVSTHHGELLDDFENMLVYIKKFKFQNPLQEFSIKFAGLKEKDSIWIYGIKLFIQDYVESNEITNLDVFKLLESSKSSEKLTNPIISSMIKDFMIKDKKVETQENKNINYLILKKLSYIEQHLGKENELNEKLNKLEPLLKRLDYVTNEFELKLTKLDERIAYLENVEKKRLDSIESLLKDIKDTINFNTK